MATVNITGSVADVVGTAAAGVRLTVQPVQSGWTNGEKLILGEVFAITADGSGDVSFAVEPGVYRVTFQLERGAQTVGMVVGVDGPYDLAEVINATNSESLTAVLLQAIAALEASLGVGGPDGVATLDGDGKLSPDERPDYVPASVQTALNGKLAAAQNLSDLGDAAAARNNLDLGNVNNTSDANKPVSTAQATADATVRAQFSFYQRAGISADASLTPDIALDIVNTAGQRVGAILGSGEAVLPGAPVLDADIATARLAPDGTVIDATTKTGDLIFGPQRFGLAFEMQQRSAAGAALAAVDAFGVDIAHRDLNAWVSGGQVWLYARGTVMQITDHAGDPWVHAEIRGGLFLMIRDDGTRVQTPVAGSYPWQGHSRTVIYSELYGQSLAAANASLTLINSTAFSSQFLMFEAGQRTIGNYFGHDQERQQVQVLPYEAIHNFVPGHETLVGSAGETANSGFAWGLKGGAGELDETLSLLTTCSAAGSANADMLQEGSTQIPDALQLTPAGQLWRNLEAKFIRARLFWAMQGFKFLAGPMIWNQGEGNYNNTKATYLAWLETLRSNWQDLADDWMALPGASDLGFTGKAPFITAQTCSGAHYGLAESEVPWAQLQINIDDPTTALCLGPVYDQVYAADGVHLLAAGQEMQGARAAIAFNAWLRGENWKPLHVITAVRTGATVRLTIYNHFGHSLTADTTTITGLGASHGFSWIDDGDGNSVSITSIGISGGGIDVTLSAVPTGSNPRIGIGLNGTLLGSAGPTSGNRCTIRTNSPTPPTTRDGRPVHHFLCIDRVAVTS